jgi:hypothetical protein
MPEAPHATPAGHRNLTTQPQLPNRGLRPSPLTTAPKWQAFRETIAAGVESSQHADFPVECWMVAVIAAAGVGVFMSSGPTSAGPGLPFGGGGNANIPGDGGGDIAYRNTAANPATVVVVATAGYPWQLSYDPGDLA